MLNDILSFVDFTKAFSLFDYDKDGVISIDDMRIVLKSLGHKISDEELDELIKSIDRNGKFIFFNFPAPSTRIKKPAVPCSWIHNFCCDCFLGTIQGLMKRTGEYDIFHSMPEES